jgi:hypothetical protein
MRRRIAIRLGHIELLVNKTTYMLGEIKAFTEEISIICGGLKDEPHKSKEENIPNRTRGRRRKRKA